MNEIKGKYSEAKIFIDDVEPEAISMIHNILNHPGVTNPVRIMPDTHLGKGIVIGFTMEMTNKISPEWVGVDIGCGMLACRIEGQILLDLSDIDKLVREKIPMGMNIHNSRVFSEIPFDEVQKIANMFVSSFNKKFGTSYVAPNFDEKWLKNKLTQIGMDVKTFYNSIGTLGGGNHFYEIDKESLYTHWLIIHCGSRNFGLKVANYWTNVAKKSMAQPTGDYNKRLEEIKYNTTDKSKIPDLIKKLKTEFNLDNRSESPFLFGENLMGYLFDMIFAQQYAMWNRATIANISKKILGIKKYEEEISTIHNYIDFKDFVIRKGAISSYAGEKMIIPLNMRDGILICEGKSNPEWNYSAPHGAGRVMSRGSAKELVNIEDFKETMKDVYTTSVCNNTLDESPFAYKNSDIIELAIEPTATVINRIKPILNIKDIGHSMSWKERKNKNKS